MSIKTKKCQNLPRNFIPGYCLSNWFFPNMNRITEVKTHLHHSHVTGGILGVMCTTFATGDFEKTRQNSFVVHIIFSDFTCISWYKDLEWPPVTPRISLLVDQVWQGLILLTLVRLLSFSTRLNTIKKVLRS